jgi:kynurenine formamidase
LARDYKLIDVSHTIEHGMITYQGLPAPVISDHLTRCASEQVYAPGTTFQIGKIEMVANTGTYVDSPFHRYDGAADLSDLDLYSLANLDGVVIHCREMKLRAISSDLLKDQDLRGKVVLFDTGWDRLWRTPEYSNGTHPFVARDAAEYLVAAGAALVGIDSYNIDDTQALDRPAHSVLLKAGVPIVEHLCRLDQLRDERFKFFAVPVKVKGMGTFPVRAFGVAGAS